MADADDLELNQNNSQLNSSNKRTVYCGGYRSRTDDPLRARQML
jgi:hypothetical protein